jgi:hypothetical protein
MPSVSEGFEGLGVERVHGLGAVDGEGGDAVIDVEEERVGVGLGASGKGASSGGLGRARLASPSEKDATLVTEDGRRRARPEPSENARGQR